MRAETIQKMINLALANHVDDVGETIARLIEEEKQIKSRLRVITGIKTDYMEEVKHQLEELNRQIQEVQDTCPHTEKTYHGDPSGNNDNFTVCDWCGKEL